MKMNSNGADGKGEDIVPAEITTRVALSRARVTSSNGHLKVAK